MYIAKTTALQNSVIFDRFYHSASLDRKAKTDRYVNHNDKILSLGGEALLFYALKSEGITDFEIEYSQKGKPYLKNTDNVFFNLSHSGDTVMCALSGAEVGCDTEKVRDTAHGCAKRFFCPEECDFIASRKTEEKRKDAFFRLWTLKESFVKATGAGLSLGLDSFCFDLSGTAPKLSHSPDGNFYYFKEFDFNDGYKYAVCSLLPDIQEAVIVDLAALDAIE